MPYLVADELPRTSAGQRFREALARPGIYRLPGAHNGQNIAAAFAAARAAGLDVEAIRAGIASFPGLKHRLQRVGSIDGIACINDSKATNADSTEKALAAFENVYWIAGGKAKEGGIGNLKALFPRIRRASLIGEAATDFAATA